MSDNIYRKLTEESELAKSVHLSDWPVAQKPNQTVLDSMQAVRQIVNDGLGERADAGIKVRQPLAEANVKSPHQLDEALLEIVAEELNVKKVTVDKSKSLKVELNTKVTQELKNEGLARDLIRNIAQARKEAGLEVENRILLNLSTQSKSLLSAIAQCAKLIQNETLATELTTSLDSKLTKHKTATIDGEEIEIRLDATEV